MKKTYVTFKREMARAYAEGRKRMTRRVSKFQPPGDARNVSFQFSRRNDRWECHFEDAGGRLGGVGLKCPYGQPGDQLILGTTWAAPSEYDHKKPTELPDYKAFPIPIWSYFDGNEKPHWAGKLRPGRFLPKKFRDRMPRETLKIVRAERVRKITEDDAIAEGIDTECEQYHIAQNIMDNLGVVDGASHSVERGSPEISVFKTLWDSINAARGYGWDSNPWVWVLGW